MTGRRTSWRPEEIATLTALWPDGAEQAALSAALPGRSYFSIQNKASSLGLKRPRWYRSMVSARRDAAAPAAVDMRDCLTCGRPFASEGKHNRLCPACRDAASRSTGEDYSLSGLGGPR